MDKAEYQARLDEIRELFDEQDYEQAVKLVKTIEWKRVKSVKTLCMVADIYEANEMYGESKKVLLLAYDRAPIGKNILTRLVDLAIKLNALDDAKDYYHEFVNIAPKDATRYLLKYKILKEQGAPLEKQIAALSTYKEREYTEAWAYELARLYSQAGREKECVEECDDIILWFAEGVYVVKAMELKMKYQKLTPSQQNIYDHRFETMPELIVKEEPKKKASEEKKKIGEEASEAAESDQDTAEEGYLRKPAVAEAVKEAGKEEETVLASTMELQERLSAGVMKVFGNLMHGDKEHLQEASTDIEPETLEEIQDYTEVRELEPEKLESKGSKKKRKTTITHPESPKVSEEVAQTAAEIEETLKAATEEEEASADIGEFDLSFLLEAQADALLQEVPEGKSAPEEKTAAEQEKEVRFIPEADEIAEPEAVQAEVGKASEEEGPKLQIAAEEPAEEEIPELQIAAEEPAEKEIPELQIAAEEPAEKEIPELQIAAEETAEKEIPELQIAMEELVEKEISVPEEAAESEKSADEEPIFDIHIPDGIFNSRKNRPQMTAPEEEILPEQNDEDPLALQLPETDDDVMGDTRNLADDLYKEEPEQIEIPEMEDVMDEEISSMGQIPTLDMGAVLKAGTIQESPVLQTLTEEPEVTEEPEAEKAEIAGEPEASEEEVTEEPEAVEAEIAEEPEASEEEAMEEPEAIEAEMAGEPEASEEEVTEEPEAVEAEITEEPEASEEEAMEEPEAEEAEIAEEPEASEEEATEEPEAEEAEIAEEPEASEEEATEEPEAEEAEIPEPETSAAVLVSRPEDFLEDEEDEIPAEPENEEPEKDLLTRLEEEAEQSIVHEELVKETPQEKKYRLMHADRPNRMTEEQKRLFTYFSKVPGMDDQILDAIHVAYNSAVNKTSCHGNIAIMGRKGTGKSRLSQGIVKALCREFDMPAAKFARITGSQMNTKDVVKVVAKMAGGFLIIEDASGMSEETIEKLCRAMEFRTDSMILIIEDEKEDMKHLLRLYPELTNKIDAVINIPVFTNDELVTFARTYASECGYKMDEMGVLALYTIIGDNQKEDEPVSVAQVKEMVDAAIVKAGKRGNRFGRKMTGRQTDDSNRIILYEKDFERK